MRLNRFALVAGVLALGMAACGDDVQVVEPTPPQPPPTPPVEATMAPASASVAVGNSVVFAVNASGGVAGEAASWTCSSSNTGIATVTSTSAGCSATGVAAGDVTITASVSKSGETVNVGAQLTVTSDEPTQPSGDPAFVLLEGFSSDTHDGNKVSGTVSVTVSVDRGGQTLSQVGIAVDGEIVSYQSFSGMMVAPADDGPAEQAAATFTLSFESDAYELHDDHADVAFLNGDHVLTAGILVEGSMEPILSNAVTVEFDNEDGYHVTTDPGENSALDAGGVRWWGGPDNGPVTLSVTPVSYSGAEISQVSVVFCPDDASDLDDDDLITDSAAPFEFAFACKNYEGADFMPRIQPGPDVANILNPDTDGLPVRLDFKGPGKPRILANVNGRKDGWINPDVALTSKYSGSSDAGKNRWLVFGTADKGVGGYTPLLRVDSSDPEFVDGARAAMPQADPVLSATTGNGDICAIAVAIDNLGNESGLPKAGTSCRHAPLMTDDADDAAKVAMGITEDDAGNKITTGAMEHLRFGYDDMPPTLEFDNTGITAIPPTRYDATDARGEFKLVARDGARQSGLLDNAIMARVEARNTQGTVCGRLPGAAGNNESIPGDRTASECENNDEGLKVTGRRAETTYFTASPAKPITSAYYTLVATAEDKAGNVSDEVSRTFVYDSNPPTAILTSVAEVTEDREFNVGINVIDDLSIRDYYLVTKYGDITFEAGGTNIAQGITIGRAGRTAVDGFNADPLTSNFAATVTEDLPYMAVQDATHAVSQRPAADPATVNGAAVAARDQASNVTGSLVFGTATSPNVNNPFGSVDGTALTHTTGATNAIDVSTAQPAILLAQTHDAGSGTVTVCAGITQRGDACIGRLAVELRLDADVTAGADVTANFDGDASTPDETFAAIPLKVSRVDFYVAHKSLPFIVLLGSDATPDSTTGLYTLRVSGADLWAAWGGASESSIDQSTGSGAGLQIHALAVVEGADGPVALKSPVLTSVTVDGRSR